MKMDPFKKGLPQLQKPPLLPKPKNVSIKPPWSSQHKPKEELIPRSPKINENINFFPKENNLSSSIDETKSEKQDQTEDDLVISNTNAMKEKTNELFEDDTATISDQEKRFSSSLTNDEKNYSDSNSINWTNENTPKQNKAFLIAKELMTSEQVYVAALNLLVVEFRAFIDKYATANNVTVIPRHELDKIFNTLPQLLRLNTDLLNDLENRIDNWQDRKRIADVIVRMGPFLKLYTTYMKDFESHCNYMDECCIKYPKFAKALTEFELSPSCKKLTLKHYMLEPVQRIPRYRLLLEDYLDHLEKDSDEYRDTEIALHIVKDVLHHANSSLKLAENFCKLLQIQSSLGNYEIIKPGRLFIKEGELKKLSRKEIQHRFIILFSDCLLCTIYTAAAGLRVKYELTLSGMKVHTHPGDGTEFSIITSARSFTLRAKDDQECNQWVNVIRGTISDNNRRRSTFHIKTCNKTTGSNFESLKPGREAPVWVQDRNTTMCQVCTAEFTVTFRRHHCRCCGKVVCADCSNNKAPLQYLKFQAARVCEDCFKYLLEEFENPETKMIDIVKHDLNASDQNLEVVMENIRSAFKCPYGVSAKKNKKFIPQRLKEVTGNDSGSSMSGWLYRKGKKEWKRLWFVLKDQVLYVYKASHDVVAYDSLPVLGYVVDKPDEEEEMDLNVVFRLSHAGQIPVVFSAPNKQLADMWITALNEATILK